MLHAPKHSKQYVTFAGVMITGWGWLNWLRDIATLPSDLEGVWIVITEILKDPWVALPTILGLGVILFANMKFLWFWKHLGRSDGDISPLRISVGDDQEFYMGDGRGHGNLYTIDRRLGVRLENHDTSNTLRDVELTLLSIFPDETYPMPQLLAEGLSINPGSQKMVPLVR